MRKKSAFTLLEVIIVIFIITLITGALGYTMTGTLDKGRAFRTEQAQEQLHDLLLLCVANGNKAEDVVKKPVDYLQKNGLAKNPAKLVQDGWGKPFTIEAQGDYDIIVSSEALVAYKKAHGG
jgi:prepilin-type N-terminal cleavage/methylation domain-containing protein